MSLSAPSSEGKLEDGVASTDDAVWLDMAKNCYDSATEYVQGAHRDDWERNINMFHNQHPSGSKYNSEAFKRRSRLFRPKIRSVIRKNEAATAQAFFATQDVVNISPQDDNDPAQLASAGIMQEILNYRLTKTIPWFRIVVGSRQTADVYGICAAKTYWKYRAVDDGEEAVMDPYGFPMLDETGSPVTEKKQRIIEDEPCIEPYEPENVLFDPGCDWLDPVNTSPYLILRRPMFAIDVKAMMEGTDDKTGQPTWKKVDDDVLRLGREIDEDGLEDAREKYDGQDRHDREAPVDDYEIVWVHENFIKRDDEDYHFYTLSKYALLTDPTPVSEVYFHAKGERPVVVGISNLEAFRPYPASRVETLAPLQTEANDLANLRMDSLKFSLTPLVKVRRGQKALVPSLTNRSPGKVLLMDDPVSDVVEMNPPTVNPQAWQEQDRINVDFDELAGSFSTGSVQSNRSLNETVGGMNIISGQSNALVEYDLRVYTETFIEPLLRQLVSLEQAYETDMVVLGLAADKAQLFQRYGMDQVTDDLLQHQLSVTVNVGIGSTDPNAQLQKFGAAMGMLSQIVMPLVQLYGPQVMESEGVEAIAAEIFGKAGYKDGQRFLQFTGGDQQQDPRLMQAQQQMQQMQQMMQQMQAQLESKAQEDQAKAQIEAQKAQTQAQLDKYKIDLKSQTDVQTAQQRFQLDQYKAIMDDARKREELDRETELERERMKRGTPAGQGNIVMAD
jgi:hypothetical protein